MRIIIYGINYTPELTGIGKYTGEMCTWLVSQGHDVTVVTSLPYYPEWEVHSNYKSKLWHLEQIEGVKIYRCPIYVPAKVNSLKRIIHEFSFILSIFPIFLINIFQKKYDIVLSISPPFHLGVLPLIYAKLRGSKFVTHVQDLQVDAAKELGMISNKKFLSIMFRFERYLLNQSHVVSTISSGMQERISKKIDRQIKLFPNWVDENIIFPIDKRSSLRKNYGISNDDKVILYAGNLGEKQGLENILEVAKRFKGKKDIYFLIVGSGGARIKLEAMAHEFDLPNVKFFPLEPYDRLSALLASADLHLVLQKSTASDLVMPSKLTGILAVGGCAIVTALPNTSLYKVIKDNNLGILVTPESIDELHEAIDKALVNDLTVFRTNSRRYAEQFLSKQYILTEFEKELLNLCST